MGFRVNLNGSEQFFEVKPFTAQVLKVYLEPGTVDLYGQQPHELAGGAVKVFAWPESGYLEIVLDGSKVNHVEAALSKVEEATLAPDAAAEHSAPCNPFAATNPMAVPTEGRTVHYVMPDGQHRPATVVRVWGNTYQEPGVVNMQVLLDGTNDLDNVKAFWGHHSTTATDAKGMADEVCRRGLLWRTSVHYDPAAKPGTWHWPEKV